MKPFSTLIILVSFTLPAIGQMDSGFTNKAEAKNQVINGSKEGKWLEYFKVSKKLEVPAQSTDATIFRLTVYKSGKPEGIVREYYKDGKIKSETPYKDGDANGVQIEYAENGELVVIDTLINDQGSGVIRIYYENGKVKKEYPFKKDRMMVESELYVPGLMDYVYAAIDGTIKTYYKNGSLESETICLEGKNESTKRFDKNGNEIK